MIRSTLGYTSLTSLKPTKRTTDTQVTIPHLQTISTPPSLRINNVCLPQRRVSREPGRILQPGSPIRAPHHQGRKFTQTSHQENVNNDLKANALPHPTAQARRQGRERRRPRILRRGPPARHRAEREHLHVQPPVRDPRAGAEPRGHGRHPHRPPRLPRRDVRHRAQRDRVRAPRTGLDGVETGDGSVDRKVRGLGADLEGRAGELKGQKGASGVAEGGSNWTEAEERLHTSTEELAAERPKGGHSGVASSERA